MATVYFELKTSNKSHGPYPLRLIIAHGRKKIPHTLELKLLRHQWNAKAQKVQQHPMADQLNQALTVRLSEESGKIALASLQGVDLEAIAGRVIKKKTKAYDFGRQLLSQWERSSSKKPGTLRVLTFHWRRLQAYAPNLCIEDINKRWLEQYEQHLRANPSKPGVAKLNNSSIRKLMDWISILINEAIREGIIDKNPFNQYRKPVGEPAATTWLTLDEIEAIRNLARTTPSADLRCIAWWFVLSCYTGLRYGDVAAFSPERIQAGRVVVETEKTGAVVSVKIFPALQECLNAVANLPALPENHEANKLLKIIAATTGIKKRITFHVGRHSFATNSLILGARREVVQKVLGHSKPQQTDRYAQIVDQVVDNGMQGWHSVA